MPPSHEDDHDDTHRLTMKTPERTGSVPELGRQEVLEEAGDVLSGPEADAVLEAHRRLCTVPRAGASVPPARLDHPHQQRGWRLLRGLLAGVKQPTRHRRVAGASEVTITSRVS